jgi:hypothetical protein
MRRTFAVTLLAAGILALAYLGFTDSAHTLEANVGPLDVTVALGFVGAGLLVGRRE